jgi:quinol-cytochrome oxidoreductase complex cytochrome b subunit
MISLLAHIAKITGLLYKSPVNLNSWWNFGVIALVSSIIQIVSGITLAMFYTPETDLAFQSVLNLTNEIQYGWLLRATHANGASFFLGAVYIHMARGFYYGSYAHPRQLLWVSGAISWLLMIIVAFLGHVLPWGQMSFWGAMVITSSLGAVPVTGDDLIFLTWGGFSIGTIHYIDFMLHTSHYRSYC